MHSFGACLLRKGLSCVSVAVFPHGDASACAEELFEERLRVVAACRDDFVDSAVRVLQQLAGALEADVVDGLKDALARGLLEAVDRERARAAHHLCHVLDAPVHLEKRFLASCDRTPIDWKELKNWERNTSAHSYSCSWDESEQAVRFDVSWNDTQTDRWLYPVYRLKLPQESLSGAKMVQFEVKSAQDKVENDFATQNLMLLFGDKTKTDRHIPYLAPLGSWEMRYAELSDVDSLDDVKAFRLGANPRGTKCTFWIRNLAILRNKEK